VELGSFFTSSSGLCWFLVHGRFETVSEDVVPELFLSDCILFFQGTLSSVLVDEPLPFQAGILSFVGVDEVCFFQAGTLSFDGVDEFCAFLFHAGIFSVAAGVEEFS